MYKRQNKIQKQNKMRTRIKMLAFKIKSYKKQMPISSKNKLLNEIIKKHVYTAKENIDMLRTLTTYQYQWFSAFDQLYNLDCLFILIHLLGNFRQSRQVVFLSYRIVCTQKSLK